MRYSKFICKIDTTKSGMLELIEITMALHAMVYDIGLGFNKGNIKNRSGEVVGKYHLKLDYEATAMSVDESHLTPEPPRTVPAKRRNR